jgi:hypothetical protein
MSDDQRPYIGPHDLGGRLAGAVDPEDRDLAYWERLVDALVMLLFKKNIFADAAQLRRGIEALDPKVYDKLSYYERWAASAAAKCVERGIVTQQELDDRIQRIKARGYR